MSETQPVRVNPVEIDYACDTCHDGRMRPTGEAYLTNPPRYLHRCNKCGAEQTFGVCYPYIQHVRDER